MKFTIPYTIAFLIVALAIIPHNSVAWTQDEEDIMEILESVKYIDVYTNTYNSAKNGEHRHKWKVYQLSIVQLRNKIMKAHPEYKEDYHTLADAMEVRKNSTPPGMREQCKWVTTLKGLTNMFEERLNKKSKNVLSKKQTEARKHIASADKKLDEWMSHCPKVDLSIIPQNSVAPSQDEVDLMEILESVKYIDVYTNTYNSAKDSEHRDKWKVYQLSIVQLRNKIMAAHPEYDEDDHTLADAVELRKNRTPPGMHAQCKWIATLKGLTNMFQKRLNNKSKNVLSDKQTEARKHIDSAHKKLDEWISHCPKA